MKFDDGGDHGRVGTYTVAEMFSEQAQAAPSLAAQRCSGKGQVVVWDMGLVVAMVHCCLELGMVEGYRWKDISGRISIPCEESEVVAVSTVEDPGLLMVQVSARWTTHQTL